MLSLLVDSLSFSGRDRWTYVYATLAVAVTAAVALTASAAAERAASAAAVGGSVGAIVTVVALALVTIPVAGALVAVPLVGVYERVRSSLAAGDDAPAADGPGSTLRDRGLRLALAVPGSVVAALIAGLVATLVLHAIVLSILTAAGAVAYATGADAALVDPMAVLAATGAMVVLGVLIGTLSVRFADCLLCYTGAGPVRAVVESLRFSAANPLFFGVYVIASAALFAVPAFVHRVLDGIAPSSVAVGASLFLLAVSFAVYAPLHAFVFERRVVPAICERNADWDGDAAGDGEPDADGGGDTDRGATHRARRIRSRPLVANPARVAVVVLLVTALLVGSASIRAMDVRPTPEPDRPGPVEAGAEPAVVLADAEPAFGSVSYAYTRRMYGANESANRSTGEWEPTGTFALEHDYENRRLVTSGEFRRDDGELDFEITQYMSPHNFGVRGSGGPPADPPAGTWAERVDGNWSVTMVPGWTLVAETPPMPVRDAALDQAWTVETESDAELVLRTEGPNLEPLFDDPSYPLAEGSVVRVTVDRETGYVTRVEEELHYAAGERDETRDPTRTVQEFAAWESHEIDPPASLEPSGPLETYWSIAYY